MKAPLSSEASAALAQLVEKWPQLKNDVDRGKAVDAVHRMGVSTRDLGDALHCSASRIRLLIQAAKAPPADQLLERQKKISGRELARRSKAAQEKQAAKEKEARDLQRTEEAKKAAKIIAEWLEDKLPFSAHRENVINEARRKLAHSKFVNALPTCSPPAPGTPIDTIIERTRPSRPMNPDAEAIDWHADWLARWAFFAFPDEIVRDRALNIALDAEIRGDD